MLGRHDEVDLKFFRKLFFSIEIFENILSSKRFKILTLTEAILSGQDCVSFMPDSIPTSFLASLPSSQQYSIESSGQCWDIQSQTPHLA